MYSNIHQTLFEYKIIHKTYNNKLRILLIIIILLFHICTRVHYHMMFIDKTS